MALKTEYWLTFGLLCLPTMAFTAYTWAVYCDHIYRDSHRPDVVGMSVLGILVGMWQFGNSLLFLKLLLVERHFKNFFALEAAAYVNRGTAGSSQMMDDEMVSG